MFEGLDWRSAARRSAVVIVIYLALFYVLSRVAPQTFGLDNRAEVISLLGNAVVFFFVFTVVYAFIERSRNRRMAELRQQGKGSRASGSAREEGEESGALKGRPNPNTSRKKSRRRR